MDTKNVIAAISLSAAVIILYSLFFAPTPKEIKKVNNENIKKEQSSDTPLLEENENLPKLSREDALNENSKPVLIEFVVDPDEMVFPMVPAG